MNGIVSSKIYYKWDEFNFEIHVHVDYFPVGYAIHFAKAFDKVPHRMLLTQRIIDTCYGKMPMFFSKKIKVCQSSLSSP